MTKWDPFDSLDTVAEMVVTSDAFRDGDTLPSRHRSSMTGPEGEDRLPSLRWEGVPEGTKSFAVTCFDPDAPTGSGFWHLALFNLPSDIREISEGAVVLEEISDDLKSRGVQVLKNDGGVRGYIGAAPPPGHGKHRYMYVVHALDVESLDVGPDSSPAFLGFNMFGRTLARGRICSEFGH